MGKGGEIFLWGGKNNFLGCLYLSLSIKFWGLLAQPSSCIAGENVLKQYARTTVRSEYFNQLKALIKKRLEIHTHRHKLTYIGPIANFVSAGRKAKQIPIQIQTKTNRLKALSDFVTL